MYIRTALTASTLALMVMVMPLSADESDALYKGKVVITNAGTEVEGGTTVLLELNTGAWQSAGILDASFNNAWFESAAGASMAFMPDLSDVVDPQEWYFVHPWDLAAGDSLAYLYMGGPDMTPPIYYIPGSTGMTTADSATLEPGSDWTATIAGYISMPADSGTPGKLLYKRDCVWLGTMQHGVMAMLVNNGQTFQYMSSPVSGFSDPGGIWAQETRAYDNNTASAAAINVAVPGTSWSDYLVFDHDFTMAGMQFYAKYNAASWSQIDIDAYYDGAWHDVYQGTYPHHTWTQKWFPGVYTVTQTRVRFYNSNAEAQTESYLLREVQFLTPAVGRVILWAPLDSGSHTITLDYNNPTAVLSVDGVAIDTEDINVAGALTDNANTWTAADAAAVGYMKYLKMWQGATLQQHIEWELDTTFTDLSGNGHDATPSFPTGSSDADVSAVLASMEVIDPAAAPAVGGDESGGLAGGLPDEPDNMYDELAVDHLPGAEVINALLDAGDIPQALFWFLFVFLGIIIACLFMYRLSHSLFAMSLVAGAGLLFASRIGIVPFWVTVPVVLVAAAVLIKEKMSPL